MASYVYNPSKKVTELLSTFLEFDPKSLEMGIWSGDLSLKNVHLKRDAVRPLLNRKRAANGATNEAASGGSRSDHPKDSSVHQHQHQHHQRRRRPRPGWNPSTNDATFWENANDNGDDNGDDPTRKDPLRIQLVRGSIGHLRVRIPWKQLVWGQGAVHLEISDVTIVLSFQSREETAREEAMDARKKRRAAGRNGNETATTGSDDDYDYDYDYDNYNYSDDEKDDGEFFFDSRVEETDDKQPSPSFYNQYQYHKRKRKRRAGERDPRHGHGRGQGQGQGHSRVYRKAYQEAKQRKLREAEKRQFLGQHQHHHNHNSGSSGQGQQHREREHLALWLERLHQSQSIAKEAHRAEQRERRTAAAANGSGYGNGSGNDTATAEASSPSAQQQQQQPAPPPPNEGKFDRFLKSFSSDLFWRLFAGVKGSISKARIVLLQDGVEVGCIVQSIEVLAGKDGIESLEIHGHNNYHNHNQPNYNHNASVPRHPSGLTAPTTNAGSSTTGSGSHTLSQPGAATAAPIQYEGAYDDGEHVDKLVRHTGLGIFIRKETHRKQLHKIPNELRFSTSVEADDYILRPVAQLSIGFSLFYPHPPERRKKVVASPAPAPAPAPAPVSTVPQATTTTTTVAVAAAATAAATAAARTDPSSLSSSQISRNRRGKRDKQPTAAELALAVDTSMSMHSSSSSTNDDENHQHFRRHHHTHAHGPPMTNIRTRLDTIPSAGEKSPDNIITPASLKSNSDDTFFSDPRIPLDDELCDTAPLLPRILSSSSLGGLEAKDDDNKDDHYTTDQRGRSRPSPMRRIRSRSADSAKLLASASASITTFPQDNDTTTTTKNWRHHGLQHIQRLRTPIRSTSMGSSGNSSLPATAAGTIHPNPFSRALSPLAARTITTPRQAAFTGYGYGSDFNDSAAAVANASFNANANANTVTNASSTAYLNFHRFSHRSSTKTAASVANDSATTDFYSTALLPDLPSTPCPRLQFRVGVDEVQVVFTTRHYELLNYLCSTIARMENGRPDRTIRSVKETEPGREMRALLKKHSSSNENNTKNVRRRSSGTGSDYDYSYSMYETASSGAGSDLFGDDRSSDHAAAPAAAAAASGGGIISYLWPSSSEPAAGNALAAANYNHSSSDETGEQFYTPKNKSNPESCNSDDTNPTGGIPIPYYQGRRLKSARQEVVAQWWKYAIGAIKWEIRKRKHTTSVYRDMYISFDWNKQRHRRQEYIDLYIAHKLHRNSNPKIGSSRFATRDYAKKQKEADDKLLEIEDELPIEQILLYRSIARSMKVLGTSQMPPTVYELWGKDGLTSAKIARRRAKHRRGGLDTGDNSNNTNRSGGANFANLRSSPEKDRYKIGKTTSFASNDGSSANLDDEGGGTSSGLLAVVQKKFDSMQRLREPGGVQAHLATYDGGSDESFASDGPVRDAGENSRNDSGNARAPPKDSAFPESASHCGIAGSTRFYTMGGGTKKDFATTIGDVQSKPESRTIRSHRTKRSHRGSLMSAANSAKKVAAGDNRMRLFFSFQIKKFNLIVVEEDYVFDLSPEMDGMNRYLNRYMDSDTSGADEPSGIGDVSDLSVLTDDRLFSEDDDQVVVTVEEEEAFDNSGKPKMKSTDFLSFGRPENPVLRLTISSLVATSKGISGGGMEVGVSVASIEAAGDDNTHILSMGPSEPHLPVEEVDIDGFADRKPKTRPGATDVGSVDLSTYVSGKHQRLADGMLFTRSPSSSPRQAISLKFSKEGPSKILQCDLSKIAISANLQSAEKLLSFYSRPDVKQPETLLTQTSRDVARKLMIKKISNAPTIFLSNLTSAIRVHGIELRVPLEVYQESKSEHSEIFSYEPEDMLRQQRHRISTHLVADVLELYSGTAVDELVQSAAIMSEGKDRSIASGSFASFRTQTGIRTLDMLDIAGLTSANDSFASNHFVLTVRGVTCGFTSDSAFVPALMRVPIDVEVLITSNGMSLLDTEIPKHKIVVEISPVNILLSEYRLSLLAATQSALDLSKLSTNSVIKKTFIPDPPRIEILSQRILSSLDLTCSEVRIELIRDKQVGELGPPKIKELVMEEALSDFLSIIACFDLNLTNEEALSSAIQVCIGRLMGLGLTDDQAWACANAARVNFLDDITLMRRTESQAFAEMAQNIAARKIEKNHSQSTSSESSETDDEKFDTVSSNDDTFDSDEFSDDDSKNSALVVETTINSAVENTVASFSTLLQPFFQDNEEMDNSTFLFIDLPMGFSLSMVQLFYDQHVTSALPYLVVTNKAGIELLTLVPSDTNKSVSRMDEMAHGTLNHGILVSRFNLDHNYGFGEGGLPMSVLATDEGEESDLAFRERSRLDDIEVGELEFFFSCPVFEEIIEEINELLPKKKDYADCDSAGSKSDDVVLDSASDSLQTRPLPMTSTVLLASSLSLLFTSESLVPFCRITLKNACIKSGKATELLGTPDTPTYALGAMSFSVQNLSPEGQCFHNILELIEPNKSSLFPFQARFFRSPDAWRVGNRLELDFTSFRFFLVRQFVNDFLHYFAYDQYGVGKLKKRYEKNVVDIHGNVQPPLIYSIHIYDTSIICPRNSTSTDMVAFEVEDSCISVSYIPKTFAMPTESSPFCANPTNEKEDENNDDNDSVSRSNSFISLSDNDDCESHRSTGNEKIGPISSHTSDLKRRLKINLDRIRLFTAIAGDKTEQEIISSSLFRFIHTIDGRAEHLKSVYARDPSPNKNLSAEDFSDFEEDTQTWEEISTNPFSLEILFDSAPHTRLLVSSNDGSNPLSLDARLSQLCLLLSVWDSNMQELGTMCPVSADDIFGYASPPTIPDDFPEYASEEFVSYLERIKSIGSEICCIFKKLSVRCTFDEPGYFSKDPDCFQYFEDPACADEVKPGLTLTLEDMVVHVLSNHLNVKRIGMGSSSIDIIDERRAGPFQKVLSSDPRAKQCEDDEQQSSWADLSWGLRENVRTLDTTLPQPVQCSIFMTPRWSHTNLGIQSANGTMHDLSWIWVIMGYFKSYYCDDDFGNPGFEAQKWSHKIKNALRRSANKETHHFAPQPGLNIDFRVWLCRPTLCLPSDYIDARSPSLTLSSETGLWYRYKSIENFASQEVVTTDLNLSFTNEFLPPETYRREAYSRASRTTGSIRPLIEGLSFGLRYDSNSDQCNHMDMSLAIPFSGENIPSLSIVGKELEIEPFKLDPPRVLKPFIRPTRHFGPKVCDMTCIIEVLPLASSTLMNFFCGPLTVNSDFVPDYDEQPPKTLSITAKLRDIRVFLIDPDLGVQLPMAVLSLSSSTISVSKFAIEPITEGLVKGKSQPADMQIILVNNLWIDYFKLGLTRSWEPLLEPFKFQVLYESSSERGQGYSLNSDSPFHFNLSGAFLSFLSEATESISRVIRETFGEKEGKSNSTIKRELVGTSSQVEGGARLEDTRKIADGNYMSIIHEVPTTLKGEEKVAFSLRNLTGQRIRIHQQSNSSRESAECKPVVVTYLNQGESAGLTFAATISVVKNLRIVEVPYPGFEVSTSNEDQRQGSLHHAVDMQIPGCRWIQGVRLDSFGRKFQSLTPRSPQIFEKISNDWRLRNAMTVLTEVGPDNGGRLLSVRSIFEIKNNTTHSVKLNFHPDPKHKPDIHAQETEKDHNLESIESSFFKLVKQKMPSDSFTIEPGCDFQLPTILIESSLEMDGSHLGSVWVRPDTSHTECFSFRDFSKPTESKIEEFDASFCSRPVQLAKIVHETCLIYNNGGGEDIKQSNATSGVQVSCPTHSQSGNIRTPFCYAIEICRSPIVKSDVDRYKPFAKKQKKFGKPMHANLMHGPVAYSLVIHPPIVIVNLLPEGGRFELMHAIRKTVVWYADLKPGEQVPVHSLGLDVPLLLLVNLGYCRTPVGEGALVHHGGDSAEFSKEQSTGLRSLGKIVSKGTKKIGRKLTNLTESPDKRAQERVAKMFSPKSKDYRRRKGNVKHKRSAMDRRSLDLDLGETGTDAIRGKVHAIEALAYSTEDIADETTVVDSVGQRLRLRIENIRGGGGQRRISLYCPFWIVNTTEHALRYREDKEKRYVSGTVHNPEKNGSMPVDGSNRSYRSKYEMQSKRKEMRSSPSMPSQLLDTNEPMNQETVFAGTHGAIATSPGRCTLSPEDISLLIEEDMPLQKLAGIAFMFNFFDESILVEKLVVQLYDGLETNHTKNPGYISGWSAGFALETVGFSQVISLPCKDGRMLELSATVNVAPGFLSGYTKIVRFCPRYAIYNRLERPIRLWQDSSVIRTLAEDRSDATNQLDDQSDSRKWRYDIEDEYYTKKIGQYESLFGRHATLDDKSLINSNESEVRLPDGTAAHRSALYISSIGPSQLVPFFLPDTRSESQLRIDLGGPWNLTASFASNVPGEHVLDVTRATDIRFLNHVSIRDSPKYKIILPPLDEGISSDWDGELGAYFETESVNIEERKILVKGTKRGKYAFNHTDMRVGDELLRINGISVLKFTFEEAMKMIKDHLSEIRAYEDKKLKRNSGPPMSTRGVLKRLSMGGKQITSTSSESGKGGKRGLKKRLSLSSKRRDLSQIDEEPQPLTLTFRTQEERLRKKRIKAIRARNSAFSSGCNSCKNFDPDNSGIEPIHALTVETKAIHNTMFIILRNADEGNPPFKIQNRSLKYYLFYRQRNCDEHEWNILMPGESRSYSWEEPMKSKKLTVRSAVDPFEPSKDGIGNENTSGSICDDTEEKVDFEQELEESGSAARTDRLRQILAYQYVNNEERGGFGLPTTVRLEEIGFHTLVPVPSSVEGVDRRKKYLNCEVDTDGGTRLLVISDLFDERDERETMHRNIDNLRSQIAHEERRSIALKSMRYALSQPIRRSESGNMKDLDAEKERANVIENDLRELTDEFPEGNSVTKRCQVVVQVLEAFGLSSSDFVGTCDPYCEVFYKGRLRSRKHFLQKRMNKRKTYFIEKTSNPRWNDQYFVFDVPEEAINVTRGHSIQVVVRDFRIIGQHPILGQASIHFGSIRNEQELVGWWPLVGRYAGNTELSVETDSTRGSIKLRVQWIYTLPAMIDYYLLMSQRRILTLTKTEEGMQDQLKFANESFQRKREAINKLPGGGIAHLVKLQKKNMAHREAVMKRELLKKEKKNQAKPTSPLNTNFKHLRETLKKSRTKSLTALTTKMVESKRKRRLGSDEVENDASSNDSVQAWQVRRRSKSASTSSQSTEHEQMGRFRASLSPSPRNRTISLEDFFAQQHNIVRPRRVTKDWNITQRRSHRKLSRDLDDPFAAESIVMQNSCQPLTTRREHKDSDIEDLISVSTDAQEQARRKNDIARLKTLGFVFHDSGEFFHEDHLPNHFRRLLFARSKEERKCQPLYCRRHYVGASSVIRHFKNWQAAQALLWDSELKVVNTEKGFLVQLKPITNNTVHEETDVIDVISKKLSVPSEAPRVTIERSHYRTEAMHLARDQFDRSCRRILGCVLNPGGWLTIRPIVAMNLPDSYTGMYVKVFHGSEVQITETVDAKVSPKWSSTHLPHSSKPKGRRRSSVAQPPNTISAVDFEFSANDLHLQVEPQQTGGSIRLSVIAERYKTKVELGVVHIPLGAAIAACIDAAQDIEMSGCSRNNEIPLYTRWFPLLEPQLTVPVAGDMGLSTRPQEHEQLRDNMFQHYFAPCIQLSLIWWPYEQNQAENENQTGSKKGGKTSPTMQSSMISRITRIPTIQTYFNSDISIFSVALIDSVRAVELLNLSLREIDVKYAVTRARTRIGLVIGWIQLDQQDDNSREPVVFAPTPSEYPQPTLQFLALRDNLRTKTNIVSYEYVGVALQEMDLTVEEPRVYELWDFFMAVLNRKRIRKQAARGQQHSDVISRKKNIFTSRKLDESKPSLFEIIQSVGDHGALSQKQKMYVEQLILGLVKINLSYVKGRKQNFESSDNSIYDIHDFTLAKGGGQLLDNNKKKNEKSEIFTKWSQLTSDQDSALDSAGAHNLPGIIAAVFPSVSDAPIRLQGKLVEHVFESPIEIVSSLKNYYSNETLKQVYKIIGSLDLVGNPTILLTSFMSGVKDLVSAPTAAFMKSPANVKQVGIGVGKGTVSFLSHFSSGFFGFTARVFSQLGQTTAFFSLDSDYRQWHRDRVVNEATNLERVWKRRGMPKVEEIILRPIADVFLGFTLGVSGVVFAPYRGAQKGGTRGFFIGTGVGIAGLVTKPIVGVFDAMMHGSQSIHDIAKTINFLERRYQPVLKLRLPYVFGPMKILSPFDANSARSVYLLGLFPPRTKLKHRQDKGRELHIHSEVLQMEPGVEIYAIVTTIRVVLIRVKRDSTKATNSLDPSFGWEVDLSTDATISSQISDHGHNGVAMTITKCDDVLQHKIGKRESKHSSTECTYYGFEFDEDFEDSGELGENFHTPRLDPLAMNSSTATKPIGESVSSGIKQQGNTYVEWFTVLAEYQQRRQLNRIHNVICCVLGDFDKLMPESTKQNRRYTINDATGTACISFGIYNFEKGLPDGRAVQISNMKVIASLEDLHWIEDDLVKRISNMSSFGRRQKALAKIRQTWSFSNDMKVSKNMGGPEWLIRARAKAMFVPSGTEEVFDGTDAAPLSSRTMHEIFEGYTFDHDMTSSSSEKKTSETCDPKIQDVTHSTSDEPSGLGSGSPAVNNQERESLVDSDGVEIGIGIASEHIISNSAEGESASDTDGPALAKVDSVDSKTSSGPITRRAQTKPTSIPRSESENVFCSPDALGLPIGSFEQSSESKNSHQHSMQIGSSDDDSLGFHDFYSPINGVIGVDGRVEFFRKSISRDANLPPVASLNVPGENLSAGTPALEAKALPNPNSTASHTRNDLSSSAADNDSARIDRLEGIIEQLVLLNAAQARREELTARERERELDTSRSQLTGATEVHLLADNLRQELGDIREKMEERARADEALRQEISLFRDQLADRRVPEGRSRASTIDTTGSAHRDARGGTRPSQPRPPQINTSLFPEKKKTTKNPIRGIFQSRVKSRRKIAFSQQQQHPDEESRVLDESCDIPPEPILGLDEDEIGSGPVF